MSDTTISMQMEHEARNDVEDEARNNVEDEARNDVEDEAGNENLVRDYLLHQLQINMLHAQWRDKAQSEAVEELMEAKRTMQEMEDDVVKKFSALNKQYENINGIINPEEVRELDDYQKILQEIDNLSAKRQATLERCKGDAKTYLEANQALVERLTQLERQIINQRETVALLNSQIFQVDSKLLFP